MSNVLSDLFVMGNPPNPTKAARKQPNPRICNGGAALSGDNSGVVEGKKRKLNVWKGLKDLELSGFSRTKVTVIDTSLSPDWKVFRVLYRKGLAWKVREWKVATFERKKKKLLKAKERNEGGAGWTGRREQLPLLEKSVHSRDCCFDQREHCRMSTNEHSYACEESCKFVDSKTIESENGIKDPAGSDVPDKIVPLSGNPFFTSIVVKSQLQKPFQLGVPKHFYEFLPCAYVTVILSCRSKSWEMSYAGHLSNKRILCGWDEFAMDNSLEIGDACVYELMDKEKLEFRVQILKGKIPREFAIVEPGQNFDSPIMIE